MNYKECPSCGSPNFRIETVDFIIPIKWSNRPYTKDIEQWTFCNDCNLIIDIKTIERNIEIEESEVLSMMNSRFENAKKKVC